MGYFKAEKALLSRHPVGPTARWVVPFNRDSGNMRGTSSIYGERKRVRKAMYMATLSAVRWNISLHEFYVRLVTKGKRKNGRPDCLRSQTSHPPQLTAGHRSQNHPGGRWSTPVFIHLCALMRLFCSKRSFKKVSSWFRLAVVNA